MVQKAEAASVRIQPLRTGLGRRHPSPHCTETVAQPPVAFCCSPTVGGGPTAVVGLVASYEAAFPHGTFCGVRSK